MDKAFTTPRLTFLAFDETDESQKSFFHKSLSSDPINFSQFDDSLFRPQRRKTSDDFFKRIAGVLLPVVIYLTPIEDSDTRVPDEKPEKEKEEDQLVPIGILLLRSNPLAAHDHHRSCLLGISLAAEYQGKGYGSAAIEWAVDWAFRHGNMHSVGLECFGWNVRAVSLYEKLGFVKEGVLRERLWFDGRWHDEILFGMIRGDWEKLRGGK
jgi:RimJ/RimL family protein N-acetyltransferase